MFEFLQNDVGLWPVGGIVTVRHYLRDCLGWKLRLQVSGKQLMASLPASRLKPRTHMFTYAASELAGPFSVVVGRSTVKRWLCIFVCTVTTSVRIEAAVDLSTTFFINAFRRFLYFASFRIRFIRTDNVTNFVGGNNVLKKEALKLIQSLSVWQAKVDESEVGSLVNQRPPTMEVFMNARFVPAARLLIVSLIYHLENPPMTSF